MSILIVVNNPANWPLSIRGVEVVAARQYLSDPSYHRRTNTRVVNLCRSYSYQSLGYYVSLLAEARAQKPEPDVSTIQNMKSATLVRTIAEDLNELIQKTFRRIRLDRFILSIYFGRTLAQRDKELGRRLFSRFRSPLLRALFTKRNGDWYLQSVRPIPASEIPPSHHEQVIEAAEKYLARRMRAFRASPSPRHCLAILHDPTETTPPSNLPAIRKFVRAARRHAMEAELITRDDYARLSEFDALFIRATTFVNNYTYRFARRAAAEGLAVIDDPLSIARCTNKVYLAELLKLHRVPTPATVVVHRDNVEPLAEQLTFPVVLKQPDSAFSLGVTKAADANAFIAKAAELLAKSEVVVAQAFVPSDFDWRIGVLDGKPLYASKYFMAPNHWQIVKWRTTGESLEGKAETVAVADAPPQVVRTAVRAARLIGDGLYGVDLKVIRKKVYVIEVNDNPNLDARCEDRVLKDELYDAIILSFIRRIERLRSRGRRHV
ncbi:MAG: RimK family protein [Phycisphaerae bacterium]|nr:RimK family protein [Phycisphaerae bacterium]